METIGSYTLPVPESTIPMAVGLNSDLWNTLSTAITVGVSARPNPKPKHKTLKLLKFNHYNIT